MRGHGGGREGDEIEGDEAVQSGMKREGGDVLFFLRRENGAGLDGLQVILGQLLKGLERGHSELIRGIAGMYLLEPQRIHQGLVIRCDYFTHSIYKCTKEKKP